jgi:hypothetical protein
MYEWRGDEYWHEQAKNGKPDLIYLPDRMEEITVAEYIKMRERKALNPGYS